MSLTLVAANVPSDLVKYLDLQELGEVASALLTNRAPRLLTYTL